MTTGGANLWVTVIVTLVLSGLSLTLFRPLMNRVLSAVHKSFPGHGSVLATVLVSMLIFSLITEHIGIHAVFGAFLLGIAVNSSKHFTQDLKDAIHTMTSHVFAPVFFVAVGLKVNFLSSFDAPLILSVLVVAFFTKILAGLLGGALAGLDRRESLATGLGIAARGGMGIILATLSLDAHLINDVLFEALVVMALLTSMASVFIKPLLAQAETTDDDTGLAIEPTLDALPVDAQA